jgi:magnesium-transporting ATPase (P-type)
MGQTPAKGNEAGPFTRFVGQFNNILVHVLLAAGSIKLMMSLWIDAGIIFSVVVLNALLGFVQEGKPASLLPMFSPQVSPGS